jgi:hypothetical protein
MKMRPVLSRVYDLITEESKEPTFWNEHVAPPSAYRVSLLKLLLCVVSPCPPWSEELQHGGH